MASNNETTSAWLQAQWSNPSDIFTILLIVGGDIVQKAIAQLTAGPIPHFTPVSFSFGWVHTLPPPRRVSVHVLKICRSPTPYPPCSQPSAPTVSCLSLK